MIVFYSANQKDRSAVFYRDPNFDPSRLVTMRTFLDNHVVGYYDPSQDYKKRQEQETKTLLERLGALFEKGRQSNETPHKPNTR
jgi:hypothetical protein